MNQNPEQKARDIIDKQLASAGWIVQKKNQIDLNAGLGVAVAEYQTSVGPADYILFVDGKPVGIIEAKRAEEGQNFTVHEQQVYEYSISKLKHLNNEPLTYVYLSNGKIIRFSDFSDPFPLYREVFNFHRPETLYDWNRKKCSLRRRLKDIPILGNVNSLNDENTVNSKAAGLKLRYCQFNAIWRLEDSLRKSHPKALIQMATGAGKTYTAITSIYRMLKFAGVNRVLFLVDTKNLGEQAEQEFMAYVPIDDNRKFTELYSVQRLKSNYIATDSQVCISTIQRMYSILKGTELDESAEEVNPYELNGLLKEPMPVVYNEKLPVEFFDAIVIDECHRSIYNLWKQVLDYFDAFLIGLTATPDNRTFGFFNQNIVSEYTHEQAVADGVNVGYDVFLIDTKISRKGASLWKGQYVETREKLSRDKRWDQLDEDYRYAKNDLDVAVVNPSQIRTVINEYKNHLNELFPGRNETPKTLIFAKSDSHADDIISIVRDIFAEGNNFCKKVTYKAEEDPKSILSQFRNDYYPRVAVTVDMIATGTDIRPLECLIFMRDVRSKNYFEQMKGRGTRTISLDDLKKVTPSAVSVKDHFIIIDAVNVTLSNKTDSRPLDKKPGVPLKTLLDAVTVGARDEDIFTTLAGRLSRLDRQLNDKEKNDFRVKAKGKELKSVVKDLLNAYDPDILEDVRNNIEAENKNASPGDLDELFRKAHKQILNEAAKIFTGELNGFIENVRKIHEQLIDSENIDSVIYSGWSKDGAEKAEALINDFNLWIEENKNEIEALQIFYSQPYRRRELTFNMIRDLAEILKQQKPQLAPASVWQAYERLEKTGEKPLNELVALVSLIRRVCGIDSKLTPFDKTVDKNFKDWIFKKHAGKLKFNAEQMEWLRMIKDHIANSFHIEADDFDYAPFDALGGRAKMYKLFNAKMNDIINELNEELAA